MKKNDKIKIYFAAGLFSEMERDYNLKAVNTIKETSNYKNNIDIYLPQLNESINDKSKSADSIQIFRGDSNELDDCNILVAIIDGPVIDPGVAAEIGYVAGRNSKVRSPKDRVKIILLSTDSRDISKTGSEEKIEVSKSGLAESQFIYQNLYVVGAGKANGVVVSSIQNIVSSIDFYIEKNFMRN